MIRRRRYFRVSSAFAVATVAASFSFTTTLVGCSSGKAGGHDMGPDLARDPNCKPFEEAPECRAADLPVAALAGSKQLVMSSLKIADFMKRVKDTAATLHMDMAMLKRPLNVGFSGGEKKRAEILQMKLLEPKLCVMDETDSGLDIDALKIVADGVNSLRAPDRAVVVITHYQRLLEYIVPDTVHVLYRGQVIKSGDKELAHELEANGYAGFIQEAAE